MSKAGIFILIALAMLIIGCGANGVITDYGSQSTKVSGLKLSSGKSLEILTAGTVLTVPLTKIKSIRLHQDETKDFQQKMYCLAEVLFLDGTKVGTFNPNSSAAKAWVRSDVFLTGKSENGAFKILVNDVEKVDMVIQ